MKNLILINLSENIYLKKIKGKLVNHTVKMTECANTALDQVRNLITISLNFLKRS